MTNGTTAQPLVENSEFGLTDVVRIVRNHLRLLIIAPLAVGSLALGGAFLLTPIFTATTRILPPQQQQSAVALISQQLGALAGAAGVAGVKNPADTYVAMLQSRTVADSLADRFKLVERYQVDFRQDARKVLASASRIRAGKDGVILIEVDDPDPKVAAELANAYVDELRKLTGKLAVGEASQRRVFFEQQLRTARDELSRAELELGGSGVSESALKADPQAAVAGIAGLKAAITAAEVKLASMRAYLTPTSPEYRQVEHELGALRAQLNKAQKSDLKIEDSEYITKYRDFKYYETLFELIAKQYEIARIDEAREGALIQVIDPAVPPERKSKPKRALIAVVATIATFVCLLFLLCLRAETASET